MCAMTATAPAARPAARSAAKADKPHVRHASDYWGMLKQTASDWMEDKAMKLAASLAFYTLLSIAPLLVIAIKIVGKVFSDKVASGQVYNYLTQLMGSKAADAVNAMVVAAGQPGHGVI